MGAMRRNYVREARQSDLLPPGSSRVNVYQCVPTVSALDRKHWCKLSTQSTGESWLDIDIDCVSTVWSYGCNKVLDKGVALTR